jgi:hypothetical protein
MEVGYILVAQLLGAWLKERIDEQLLLRLVMLEPFLSTIDRPSLSPSPLQSNTLFIFSTAISAHTTNTHHTPRL